MGENSTTLGDQVGSPRVVPILRFRTRFFHIRRSFVRYRHSHTTLQAHFAILRFCDFAILRFWASIGTHDVIIMGTSTANRGGGIVVRKIVCHYFRESGHKTLVRIHTPIQPRSQNCTSEYVRKHGTRRSRAVDAKVHISPRATKPDFTAPIKRAYTSQTYTHYGHPKVCPRRNFLCAVHETFTLCCVAMVA